jgi:hypothetical protein
MVGIEEHPASNIPPSKVKTWLMEESLLMSMKLALFVSAKIKPLLSLCVDESASVTQQKIALDCDRILNVVLSYSAMY